MRQEEENGAMIIMLEKEKELRKALQQTETLLREIYECTESNMTIFNKIKTIKKKVKFYNKYNYRMGVYI